jgi:hypothetical protein
MKKVLNTIVIIVAISLSLYFISCSASENFDNEFYPLQKLIAIPDITEAQREEFNENILSEFTSAKQENGKEFSGYETKNKIFLEKVITPLLEPHLADISSMKQTDIINYFTLFSFEIYQRYFGKSFYRWGGDDLDHPQESGTRNKCTFGLDCSGFVTMPYELAVYFGLMNEDETLFSSKGYRKYCLANEKQDIGGREGTSNNFRIDTRELAELGAEVFSLKKGQVPTTEQIKLLQPGDIVGRSGHFGMIAELNGEPYYFESGGRIVPRNGGIPVNALDALKIFASTGAISVRRCLDKAN